MSNQRADRYEMSNDELAKALCQMKHLGFDDWSYSERKGQGAFVSTTQLHDAMALFTPLHPDTARLVFDAHSLVTILWQQIECMRGLRKRGWDLKFLGEQVAAFGKGSTGNQGGIL